jgi:WD40 repeat protein/tetratricopeptide (TPR) repeat protein
VIPKDLETIVLKAMAKEPQARYATTRDLADDLKRFLADEPIRARRRTLADRAAKWARRHQPIVWASVAVLLIALAASLVSVLLIAGAYEQEKTQRLTAQRSEARALTAEDLAKQQERLARKQEQLANQQRELAVAQRDLSERNLYVAHMRLAAQDWESGQIDRLHEMLDGHVPRPDRPDLRGWEWYYYLSLCHSDLTTFRGHNGGVHSCAWSPDGKRLASGGHDGAVKIWNAATGQEILTLRGHQGVRCVDWSADGKRLASGGSDRTVRIWDEATGKQLFTFTGFAREVRSVAWSPDGQRLAAGDRVRTGSPHKLYTVRVWDAAEGRELLDLKGRASAPLAWSPDGKRLATGIGGEPPGVRVWDVAEGREVLSFSPAGWSLFVLAWSPDGKRLASGQYNSLAQVWDLTTGQEVVKLRHRGSVEGLAWSRDSKHLATASRDQTISVWDPTTGEEVFRLHGHRGWVSDVAWSPEGSRLASAGNDGTVKIWDAQRKQDAVHIDRVGASHLAWSPKGDRLASAGGDKVRIWDPSKGEELLSLDIPAALVAWSLVAWSPDGRQLAAAGGSRTAIVDTQTGKQVATLQTGGVKRMCWSPDGTRLAVTHHGGGPVDVWDVRTGQLLLSRRAPGKFDDPSGLDWSPDGSRIATGEGGMVRIWDAATGKAFLALRGHAGSFIWSVAWSPDGKRLASGGWDQIVKVWDASRGRELLSLAGHTADVFTVDWSPDGTRLASTGWDATIKIWDAFTGDQMISLLGSFIAWSPDGHRVATIADPEGTITIYDASAGYAFANSPEYPRDLYQARARDYWRSGEFDKAIAEYGELIRIDPKSATGYTSRAALYRRKGQFDKAIADYDQVIRLDPQSAAAYFNRAQAHLEKSDFDRAPADLSKAVELAPDHALFWYWRALARVAAGRLDEYRRDCAEMLRHFGATEDADAAHWTAWSCTLAPDAAADWSVPLALAKKAAKGDPDSIQYMITHGAVLYRAGRVQQAIQRLMDAEPLHQALDPTLPSSPAYAWFYLAMAHHRLGHGDEAKKFLNKAAAAWMDEETREPKAPTAPRPAWNRRLTLKLLSDEAHTLLKTDAARLPESPGKRAEACYVRGRAHAEKGELAQAIAAYDEAIKLDPHWVEYYGDRGNLHAQKGQLDLAIADFTEAIRLDPSDPQARVNRGSAYIDKGEPQKAAADFKEALRVNPLCAQQCFARAEDCRKANQRERALAEYRKAMRLDLLYTRTYLTHSALIGVDRLDQALAEFRQLIQVRTDVPPAWLHGASCWLPAMIRGTDKAPGIVFVSDMPWVRSTCGWQYGTSPPGYLRSATGALGGFPSLKVAWSHAFQDATPADCVLDISGHKFTLFKAHVGPLDFHGSVQFQVLVDAKVKQETPVLRPGELEAICVDVAGAKEVVLRLLNGGDGNAHDRAAWGFARFIPAGAEDPLEEPPAELHSATDANAALFLAEVHWRLDHKNLARRWYDKAAQWMDKNKTEAEILQRYRAEAAKLLGIPEKPSTAKTKPEKPR